MNKIITPSDVISLVIDRKTNDFRFKLYDNFSQKISFFASIVSLGLGFFSGLLFIFFKFDIFGWSALIFTAIAAIGALSYQIAVLIPEILKFRNPEREISNPLSKSFNDDMDLINQLASQFQIHHLGYAKSMYERMAKQIRERIGLLVGAIDKIGIIPIAVTTYFSYSKAIKDGIAFGPYEWIGISFIILYLVAIRLTSTAQWMEYVSEIYSQAYALKLKKQSDF